MALDYVGRDVPVSSGDYRLNSGRVIRLFCPGGPVLRTFVQYVTTFCRQPEAAGDVISGIFLGPIVLEQWVKFCDPNLNRSQEILPEVIRGSIFDSFLL